MHLSSDAVGSGKTLAFHACTMITIVIGTMTSAALTASRCVGVRLGWLIRCWLYELLG